MQKIRIVHTIPMGAGGISNLTLTINEKIDRKKYEFDYLVFRNQKEFCDERAAKLGSPKLIVDVSTIKNPIIKGIKKISGTVRLLHDENIEIVHIDASTPYDVILALAAKMAGVSQIIFHAHNDNYERKLTLRNIMQPIFRVIIPFVVTDYIAISEQAARFLFPKAVVKEKKYYLFKNGINVNKYVFNPKTRDIIRKKYNLEDKFVVGHIGRFVYQKNHEFLIDVFYNIVKRKKNAVLLLVGIGELQEKIKQKVVELGIENKVIFWGVTEDVPDLLQAMDCFIFPSNYEGLGMVAIEAQCAGLPTIVSDVLPDEVNITECLKRISLSESAEEWAKICMEFADKIAREDQTYKVRQSGYDINDVVKKLERLYSGKEVSDES